MLWNSQSAFRQVSNGGIWSFRLREVRCSEGMGELLARMIGEYISRFVTISTSLPCSFFVLVAMMERVDVSALSSVGTLDFSRSRT